MNLKFFLYRYIVQFCNGSQRLQHALEEERLKGRITIEMFRQEQMRVQVQHAAVMAAGRVQMERYPLDVMSDREIDHLAEQEAHHFQKHTPSEQCDLTPGDIRTLFIRIFRQNLSIEIEENTTHE